MESKSVTLIIMGVGFWALLPALFTVREPALGYFHDKVVWGQGLHLPMTITFFISFLLIFLFGRRAVCSWNCPCVGSRDTMGNAFRKKTIKTDTAWKFRYLKWVLTSVYFISFILVLFPFSKSKFIIDLFLGSVGVLYFSTFFFIPVTGNRNWCRWLCPYGQTFGILNQMEFYKITAEKERCVSCKKCDKECDMGIPVHHLVQEKEKVDVSDCVGYGRCISVCPKDVLRFSDVRDYFKKPVPFEPTAVKETMLKEKG